MPIPVLHVLVRVLLAAIILAAGVVAGPPSASAAQIAIRQTASAEGPGWSCVLDANSFNCTPPTLSTSREPAPYSVTVKSSPTVDGTVVGLVRSGWGNFQGCQDNLGQWWVSQTPALGTAITWMSPSSAGRTAGITSVTCVGAPILKIQFFEISGVQKQYQFLDSVRYQLNQSSCGTVAPNALGLFFLYLDESWRVYSDSDPGLPPISNVSTNLAEAVKTSTVERYFIPGIDFNPFYGRIPPLFQYFRTSLTSFYRIAGAQGLVSTFTVTNPRLQGLGVYPEPNITGYLLPLCAGFQFLPATSRFQIVPQLTGSSGPLQPIDVPEGNGPFSISTPFPVKLGQKLTLEYDSIDPTTGKTTRVPSTMTFQSQQPAIMGNISAIFSNPTRLFPENVLLHFTDPSPDEFFAVHSGTAVLDIKPKDPSSGAPEVFLTVKVPSCPLGQSCGVSLGASHNQFDDDIVRFADFRGIPPQILKGDIQRETGFNPNAYRYEPLTVDFLQVSSRNGEPGVPGDLRQDPALIPWRVQTSADDVDSAGLAQGSNLNDPNSPERALRERFLVSVSGVDVPLSGLISFVGPLQFQPRLITASDPAIEMENILLSNPRQNWICNAARTTCTPQFQAYRDFRATNRPFTAQTSLAASYGLMQVLYTVAVLERSYIDGQNIGLRPTALWQPPTSIDLGTEHLANLFRDWKNFSSFADSPQFSDASDLRNKIGIALALYNGVSRPRRATLTEQNLTEYARDVLARSQNFSPR
jgi:hypothetical protein